MATNGHLDPEDAAAAALMQDHLAQHDAYMRQQNGIPESKQEPAQREPSERALRLAKLLLDPRWSGRR